MRRRSRRSWARSYIATSGAAVAWRVAWGEPRCLRDAGPVFFLLLAHVPGGRGHRSATTKTTRGPRCRICSAHRRRRSKRCLGGGTAARLRLAASLLCGAQSGMARAERNAALLRCGGRETHTRVAPPLMARPDASFVDSKLLCRAHLPLACRLISDLLYISTQFAQGGLQARAGRQHGAEHGQRADSGQRLDTDRHREHIC
jgi:hypothetical protein